MIEGILSSSAPFVAVIDGDLQHDETRLPEMLSALHGGRTIWLSAVAMSRAAPYRIGQSLAPRVVGWRIRLAQVFLPVALSDPMSGYFMLSRKLFEQLARHLTGQGFKILLDFLLSSPSQVRVIEIPCVPRARGGREQTRCLGVGAVRRPADRQSIGGVLPQRFISFALVGALGVLVHLAVLTGADLPGSVFDGPGAATVVAIVFNFQFNNDITYRDQTLRGPRLWRGLLVFMLVCGLGAIANIGIAQVLYESNTTWSIAGAIGAMIGVVWNYAVSATLVWRAR